MGKTFLLSLVFSFFTVGSAQAAGLVPCGGIGEDPCSFCHIFVLLNNVLQFAMFTLLPLIAVVMLLIGGVMFFFAGVKPDVLRQAKGVITSVVIGLLIVFCAWVVINTLFGMLGVVKTGGWTWWQIQCL